MTTELDFVEVLEVGAQVRSAFRLICASFDGAGERSHRSALEFPVLLQDVHVGERLAARPADEVT